MSADRFTGRLALEAGRIIERREAEAHLQRVMQVLLHGGEPEPLDALVALLGLQRSLRVPEGRKLLGASARGRGEAVRFDPNTYPAGSPAFDVAMRFSQRKLTRPAARDALTDLDITGNVKTLNRFLDSLCRHFCFPLPD